ncbi:cobaltochelatase subunit CobN [Elstera litoralis]|uniref:cobaltochelatase subunit CobN n=1 Tax=Elstera litoralis TaxID=552518 RepID=UPI0038B9819B
MRINDGLHIFGRTPDVAVWEACLPAAALPELADCGTREMAALMTALDGRFIPPGPAGAPSRGRVDVFPTGRNLYTIDPRHVPTRTAWVLGQRAANELVARYLQDHGDWPQRILLDLWGSATMRTGGEDLAQAIALLGVTPVWDEGSARVSGFTILPHAVLDRPRIDVTLRISGLFRDVFPQQIALFNQIVAAVAALDEADALNPLAAQHRTVPDAPVSRIFGAAPGAYGTGVMRALIGNDEADRMSLGQGYLAGTGYAYDADAPRPSTGFAVQVRTADAYVHTQDMAGQDVLDSDAFADHEGGFAAANSALGGRAALYHLDSSLPEHIKLRSLAEEVARVVRGRLTNPRWLAGQMRHGHRGAAEIAESVDNLFAFAVLADCVRPHQFELAFEALVANADVRAFLRAANPAAAAALAARFTLANARGFWTPRRNSARELLAEMGA